jgi:hypothetical protein
MDWAQQIMELLMSSTLSLVTVAGQSNHRDSIVLDNRQRLINQSINQSIKI